MATLNNNPNSSTKKQHQRLVMAASDKGVDLHELRRMVGGSLRKLSALQCSLWIESFSGRGLPNPPGRKPPAYSRNGSGRRYRDRDGAASNPVRMILADHIEQITRLGLAFFDGSAEAFTAWLRKYRHVDHPRDLATAARGAQTIRTLKTMLSRKEASK